MKRQGPIKRNKLFKSDLSFKCDLSDRSVGYRKRVGLRSTLMQTLLWRKIPCTFQTLAPLEYSTWPRMYYNSSCFRRYRNILTHVQHLSYSRWVRFPDPAVIPKATSEQILSRNVGKGFNGSSHLIWSSALESQFSVNVIKFNQSDWDEIAQCSKVTLLSLNIFIFWNTKIVRNEDFKKLKSEMEERRLRSFDLSLWARLNELRTARARTLIRR